MNIRLLERISIGLLVVVVGCLSYLTIHLSHEYKVEKAENAFQAAKITADKKQISDLQVLVNSSDPLGLDLQNCLNGVDKWFNNASQSTVTIAQAQVLIQDKQQQIQECQIRYPK